MKDKRFIIGLCAPVALSVFGFSRVAAAADTGPCADLEADGTAVIYGAGGSATKPIVAALAAELRALTPPVVVVYQSAGACTGLYPFTAGGAKVTGTGSHWTKGPDGKPKEDTCSFPTAGLVPDFANLGNSATLCPNIDKVPDGLGDFLGPVISVNVFVDIRSSQKSISPEAFGYIYSKGALNGGVAPWSNEATRVTRNTNSFVQLFLAKASGIPAATLATNGVDAQNNQGSVDTVVRFANTVEGGIESAIGFASGEVVDKNRAAIKTLAYQHTGQTCGYWPDSAADSFDKINIRTGQYYLWSPTHWFAKVDGSGNVTDPNTAKLIAWIQRREAAPGGIDILQLYAKNSLVPECAMRVKREGDLGPLSSYAPAAPCGCYWEAEATGKQVCSACSQDSDCKTPGASKCRFGYCEAY